MIYMNADGVFNFIRVGMDILHDPLISPIVDEMIGHATVKKIPIPGFTKEDVKVTHSRGKLSVKVEDRFLAAYNIPSDVDPSKIEVTAKNGLLTIDFTNAFGHEEEIKIK